MRSTSKRLIAAWLWLAAGSAAALSDAPLLALNAYFENTAQCSDIVRDWNRKYVKETLAGQTSRGFYYRVLGYIDWGLCNQPYIRPLFAELQKAWGIYEKGLVSEPEYTAKEAELISLFFAALREGKNGERFIQEYEANTASRLFDLAPSRQYFNCTFFGGWPRCLD